VLTRDLVLYQVAFALIDDAAESFIVDVVVVPDDVQADNAGFLPVTCVAGAVEREIVQRELNWASMRFKQRTGPVYRRSYVVRLRPGPDPGVLVALRCGLKLPQIIVVTEHCNSRGCRTDAECVQMVWRSSPKRREKQCWVPRI
jgi:hypothetical protein